MASTADRQVLDLVKRLGVVRPADLEAHGIPRARLYRLAAKGLLERPARGIYVASDHPCTAEHALAQVAKRVPNGVICLLAALRFHDLTTQLPPDVWIALPERARRPRLDYPRPLEEIEADIRGIEQDTLRMPAEVTGKAPGSPDSAPA